MIITIVASVMGGMALGWFARRFKKAPSTPETVTAVGPESALDLTPNQKKRLAKWTKQTNGQLQELTQPGERVIIKYFLSSLAHDKAEGIKILKYLIDEFANAGWAVSHLAVNNDTATITFSVKNDTLKDRFDSLKEAEDILK
jgi:hypothetical protein